MENKFTIKDMNLYYGSFHALKGVNLNLPANEVTAFIRTHGIRSKSKLNEIVEKSLRDAAIWDEVKDRLNKSALGMSGGQQQRLCIARALAVQPEVLLMDEPTSALDPISTSKIEDLVIELKKEYTVIIVTHNMQQATRVSDKTAFFLLGEVVEFNETEKLFSNPNDKRCRIAEKGRVHRNGHQPDGTGD